MWKRCFIAVCMLLSVCSVGYAYFNLQLNASSQTYQAGGNISGRIHKMPDGLMSNTASLKVGDKILMNVENPYTSDKLAWQLLDYQTYSDYGCSDLTTCSGKNPISNWFAMSDEPINKVIFVNSASDFESGRRGGFQIAKFMNTNIYPVITSFNSILNASSNDFELIAERNLNFIHQAYGSLSRFSHYADILEMGAFNASELMMRNAFILSAAEDSDGGTQIRITPSKNLTFSEDYFTVDSYHDTPVGGVTSYYAFFIQAQDGETGNNPSNVSMYSNNALNMPIAVRPAVYLHLDNTVFAVSRGNGTGVGNVHLTKLSDNYTSIYNETMKDKGNGRNVPMKLRMYNSTMQAQLHDIKHTNGISITKITKDHIVNLEASGNSGNDGAGGTYTISVILLDENNDFVYYKPLGDAKENGTYAFDLTGIPVGKYKIAVVNEAYNEALTSPADSSLISNVMPLEIVDYVSISSVPKTGLEYSKNVNKGDIVGTYTTSNGVDPITTSLVSDQSVQGHENDYQLFSLNNGNIIVSDTHGLHAGDYYFKIHGIDVFGDPIGGVDSERIHIHVGKTNPTIAFQDPSTTKKSIQNASVPWKESAITTPSDGTKITYSKTGGYISLINIDSESGCITYNGNNAFQKVIIKANVDDDPNTGWDDYNSAYVEKEIIIYREVDATITPHSASSNTSVPTFTSGQSNIKPNGMIGTMQGMLGTPDMIGGDTTTYHYDIKDGQDSSYFHVNDITGVISTKAELGMGSYHFTITVRDAWSSKDIEVTVNVGLSPAENLRFYENAASNTMITKQSAKISDTGVVVFATVKGSANQNPITYRLKDGETTNVLDVHPNSGAITIKNAGTVVIIAEKQGASGQANASAELTFTVTAGNQEFHFMDESGNELPKTLDQYKTYEVVYGKDKTFQVHTDGNPPGSIVTYALKSGSPGDVVQVDPDGTIHIWNASLNTQKGRVIVQATSHDPNGNYVDKTIELPIDIMKANQTIAFIDITHALNGKGKVKPGINEQDLSSHDGGTNIEDPDYYISVGQAGNGIAWTNNGIDIEYNYSGDTTIEIPLHVEKAGNRNYNKAEADGWMKILGQDESTLAINQPGKVVYGDHFTIRSLQDDSSSSNVTYTFAVDNTIFISNPTVNGNKADFDALKCSNGAKINITVTRTADGEVPLRKIVTIEILPKDIEVVINDKTKQKGEENPPLTFQDFTSQLISWNGVQDVVDVNDVKLSTTATTNSKSGSYPITGNTKTMNTTYPNYNFIFKEGKLMVDSQVDKDVDGDGELDFNDSDKDDCPDLNIKWKDDNGNWIVINSDRDHNNIPDLNIDSNGDGIPDLNIDTDNDGKPDMNLVILKKTDWKPTKCVVVNDIVKVEYCTGTSVKPQINVDTNNDNKPDINIDTDGDMKADINIANGNHTPTINLVEITNWMPEKDFTVNKFLYDTMIDIEPVLNVDTNKDGCPDLNIDVDNDGIADLNIDTDEDQIPNVEVDTTGDGKANVNLDTNGDGNPDENIMEITEWKPDKKVGSICTMVIKQNTELEDNGIKIEKPDGTPFLPNFALKVEDVTEDKKAEITEDAKDVLKDQEVKKVFDVKLLKDNVEVQPDGVLKVKIPYDEIKNPILIRKNANGTYEKIEYKIEDGYLTYETDELGIVSIIGDKETKTSVMGTYTPNIGGAITGDETNIYLYLASSFITLGMISYLIFKRNKQKDLF